MDPSLRRSEPEEEGEGVNVHVYGIKSQRFTNNKYDAELPAFYAGYTDGIPPSSSRDPVATSRYHQQRRGNEK